MKLYNNKQNIKTNEIRNNKNIVSDVLTKHIWVTHIKDNKITALLPLSEQDAEKLCDQTSIGSGQKYIIMSRRNAHNYYHG